MLTSFHVELEHTNQPLYGSLVCLSHGQTGSVWLQALTVIKNVFRLFACLFLNGDVVQIREAAAKIPTLVLFPFSVLQGVGCLSSSGWWDTSYFLISMRFCGFLMGHVFCLPSTSEATLVSECETDGCTIYLCSSHKLCGAQTFWYSVHHSALQHSTGSQQALQCPLCLFWGQILIPLLLSSPWTENIINWGLIVRFSCSLVKMSLINLKKTSWKRC